MKNRYGLSKRALALLSTWSLLCGSAWAEHVDPAPLPDAVVKSIVLKTPDQDRMVVISRLLERHVSEAHQIARELEATEKLPDNMKQGAWQDKKTLVVAKQNELATLRMDTLAEMAAIRDRLSAAGLHQAAAQWIDKRSQVEQRFAEFDKHLSAVAKGSQARRAADLTSLKAHIEGLQSDARARETPALLPISTGRQDIPLESVPQPVSKEMPRYMADAGSAQGRSLAILESGRASLAAAPVIPADATSCGYTSADLAATPEVQLTPEITGLAAQLGYSPARIYQYVYNNIRFEPYYGSLKGSQGTYLAQAGGSTDQASLLIALLRASNIPARYIKGTVQINDSTALGQNGRAPLWLGTKSYTAAASVLAQGRFPHRR